MPQNHITAKVHSANIAWGIYGLTAKCGWEDVELFLPNGERLGEVCLNGRDYLASAVEDLEKDPAEAVFLEKLKRFLADTRCYYWYFYDGPDEENPYEVSYQAPRNTAGRKPRFMEIWHPDAGIGLSTIVTGIQEWAREHFSWEDCEVKVEGLMSLTEAKESLEEHRDLLFGNVKTKVAFDEKLIEELSQLWNLSEKEVLAKLNSAL